jgi:hypothetical protein
MPFRAPGRAVTRLFPAVIAALLLVTAACGAPPGEEGAAPVEGTGEIQTELRELPPFTRVSVASGMKVIIGYNAVQSVSLAAQGNVLMAIKTEVVDGQLIVTIPPPGVEATQPIALTVKLPALESVALSAGVVGYVEHTGSGLNLDISGGVQLTAIGDTPDLRLNATTGSHAKLDELAAQYAQISLNDGSTAELNVVTSVTGTASGGSTVILSGNPAQVDIETSSGATVQGG